MSKRSPGGLRVRSVRFALFCAFSPAFLGALACGGRSVTDGSSDGSSGAVAIAGSRASSAAGRSGHSEGNIAGAGGTGAGGTGAGGSGGAPDRCANVLCPSPICPVNTVPVQPPGGCCVSCQTVCTEPCTSCAPGSHPVMLVNACCPSCEPDPSPGPSCASGQMTYAGLRAQMLDKYSSGCSFDQDCVALAVSNRCESGCEYDAIVATQVDNWTRNLENQAASVCGNCALAKMKPCGDPVPGVCIDHICRLP